MIATLHVPYGFGDCVNGFKYDGVITDVEYVRRMTKEYDSHKWGIDEMMTTRSGKNMAINPFQKENNKYKQQTPSFGELTVYVDDKEYNPMKMETLLKYFESDKSFVAVIRLGNVRQLRDDIDLQTDLKSWQTETVKIDRLPDLDNVSKFKSMSKKDLKLTTAAMMAFPPPYGDLALFRSLFQQVVCL
jgi:hypothetical protein